MDRLLALVGILRHQAGAQLKGLALARGRKGAANAIHGLGHGRGLVVESGERGREGSSGEGVWPGGEGSFGREAEDGVSVQLVMHLVMQVSLGEYVFVDAGVVDEGRPGRWELSQLKVASCQLPVQ